MVVTGNRLTKYKSIAVNFVMITKPAIVWLPFVLCLGLISCSNSNLQNENQGWVLLRYYTNEEKGISGVEPVDLGENIVLAQEIFPGSLEDLKKATLESTTLEELPESTGTFRGSTLNWELYNFDTQIPDLGPFTISVKLGLAADESASYFVGMAALPEYFHENTNKLQSVFSHTLYAFSPIK
jgi:hypothetical protein